MERCYWKMTFIQPADPDDDRCVMLYGEMEEIVGPLTLELAEAWMAQFDNRQTAAQAPSRADRLSV